MSRFLVAIPVYNERRYLAGVLEKVRRYVSDILVIDDGSTDGTGQMLRGQGGVWKIFHPENRGYGQALISAFEFAISRHYDWLLTLDCDEQHEPAFIPKFLEATREPTVDIVSGSRYLLNFDENSTPPTDRRRINHVITCILNHILDLKLTDAFCGFKAYRVERLQELELDIPGYAMPLQLWVQAACSGLSIREIPVKLIYHDPTRHFGGLLDDPDARLEHYLEVLSSELRKVGILQHPQRLNQLGTVVCDG